MNGKPVKAADVAKLAGVERSTVSRILNRTFERHRYAPETVEAVERAAKLLNYRPSVRALALRTGNTMLVGMVLGDIANPFFGELAARLESLLRSHRYRLVICNTGEDASLQAEHVDDLLHRGIDGLIIAPIGKAGLDTLAQTKTPTVLIDRPLAGGIGPFVGLDNELAGRMLGEHLRTFGYQQVGVVMPPTTDDVTVELRRQGLVDGLGSDAQLCWEHTLATAHDPDEALIGRLRRDRTVDAVVGLTNDATLSAYAACQLANRTICDDLGVAGIDDFRAAPLLAPPVTVIAQPLDLIATTACDQIVRLMSDREVMDDVLLEPSLIQRSSLHPLEQRKC